MANKEDWNKLVMAAKMVSDPNIQDVCCQPQHRHVRDQNYKQEKVIQGT